MSIFARENQESSLSAVVGLSYDYVFELATRLTPAEQKRLVRELPNESQPNSQEESESGLTDEYIKQHGVRMENGFIRVTVPGVPLVSREKIEEIKRQVDSSPPTRTPEEREKNRRELLEILLNCPIMTDEELQGYEDARREINKCRLAYL
jgi:hypothetical protein